LFGIYAGLFKAHHVSKEEFEALKPRLQEDGFATSDGIVWAMGDASGITTIWWFTKSYAVDVMYTPSEPVQVGDSAVAGLISRAAHVWVENGDEIVVALSKAALSPVQRLWEGNRHSEQLKFSLCGGLWKETLVHVSWSAPGYTRRALTISVVALGAFLFALYLIVTFIHWAWNGSF
jgi:hypothetical protein